MNKAVVDLSPTDWNGHIMQKRIASRYAAERRFKALGFMAVALSTLFLAFLLFTMLGQGLRGFQRTEIAVEFDFPTLTAGATAASVTGPNADAALNSMDIPGIVELSVGQQYAGLGDSLLTSAAAANVRQMLINNPELVTSKQTLWLPADSRLDVAFKRQGEPAAEKTVAALADKEALRTGFNWTFLTGADATDPSAVGIWAAFKGSLMTMAITLLLAFPVGVLAALYLEEYASKNRLTDMIEVSINNLAAVPSIIFGLLGLAVFLSIFGMPRSSALVGGLTLADDNAGHRHCGPQRCQIRAAVDPRSGVRYRRFTCPSRFPSCTAACPSRHPYGDHHRYGTCAWGNGATADDRHARLYSGGATRLHRCRHSIAGANLPMVG
ncbi:MAG: phosphate transport system permease protein PstA [Pseudomonadota bacterium]